MLKSAALSRTGLDAWLTVTVQVQVVSFGWTGRPSPGTSGPTTDSRTEPFVRWTSTSSPSEVTAGCWTSAISMLFGAVVSFGSQLGSPPYESFAAGWAGVRRAAAQQCRHEDGAAREDAEPAPGAGPGAGRRAHQCFREVLLKTSRPKGASPGVAAKPRWPCAVEAAGDGACRQCRVVVTLVDLEDVLHRPQPAVVVVEPRGRGAGLDERADEHAAGVTAAGGRVLGVEQRVGRLTGGQVADRALGAQRQAGHGAGGLDRSAGLVHELEGSVDGGAGARGRELRAGVADRADERVRRDGAGAAGAGGVDGVGHLPAGVDRHRGLVGDERRAGRARHRVGPRAGRRARAAADEARARTPQGSASESSRCRRPAGR